MQTFVALAIFTLSVADDCLAVWYLRRVVQGRRLVSGMLSGLLTGMISLEVVIYAADPVYIPFNCAGSIVGTVLAMWLDDRLAPPRDRGGRYAARPKSLNWWLEKAGP
jgi:hypothetical protein